MIVHQQDPYVLTPRGHIGDADFPEERPNTIKVYLHDNYALTNETDGLSEDYVLDARFVANQSLTQVNMDLSRALPFNVKFSLPSITDKVSPAI
jgi:hypothetical protein